MNSEIEIFPIRSKEVVRILGSLNIEQLESLLEGMRNNVLPDNVLSHNVYSKTLRSIQSEPSSRRLKAELPLT